MNYGNIKEYDIANGEGVRISLFVSGCRHHCKGCFNAETWDFNFGQPYTKEVEDKIIELLKPTYVQGFSLLGGEPFEPENQVELVSLLRRIKETYPAKDIWCYTGYLFDAQLLAQSRARCECTDEMLRLIDVLVDGRFVEEEKDISLAFKGSANQRIIDVKRSLDEGRVVIKM